MGNNSCISAKGVINQKAHCAIVLLEDNQTTSGDLQKRLGFVKEELVNFSDPDLCEDYINNHNNSRVILIVSNQIGHRIVSEVEDLSQVKIIFVYHIPNEVKPKTEWTLKYEKIVDDVFTDFDVLISCVQEMTDLGEEEYKLLRIQESTNKDDVCECNIVWLDENAKEGSKVTRENEQTINVLQTINGVLAVYDSIDDCKTYIIENEHKLFIIIVSYTMGEELVHAIHNLPQAVRFFIYGSRPPRAVPEWIAGFLKKVNNPINDLALLKATILEEFSKHNFATIELNNVEVSICNQSTEALHQHIKNDNANLIWSKLLVKALMKMGDDEKAHSDLVRILYQSFPEPKQKEVTKKFENYKIDEAIFWYTSEDAQLYQILNSALRRQDMIHLFAFRSFMKHLYNQLEKNHKTARLHHGNKTFVLYRGQLISKNELKKLQDSKGDVISMNSFVSTSKRLSEALKFIKTPRKQNMERVLFIIKARYDIDSEPFADVAKWSEFETESETLFALGCIFLIKDTKYSKKRGFNVVELELCADNGYVSVKFEKYYVQDETNLLTLGSILHKMGRFDLAKMHFEELAKQLPTDDSKRADCFDGLGHIADSQGEYKEALEEHKKALSIREEVGLKNNKEVIALSHINIASVYESLHDYENSQLHIMKAMDLINDNCSCEDLRLACYNIMGSLHVMNKNYEAAHQQFESALDIAKGLESVDEYHLAAVHQNIGRLYFHEKKFQESCIHCQQALEIRNRILPTNHPSIGNTYQVIAAAQMMLENDEQALVSYKIVREIYKAGNAKTSDLEITEKAILELERKLQENENHDYDISRGKNVNRGQPTEDDSIQDESDSSRRIILLGRSGVGKSLFGNLLLGSEKFTHETTSRSTTKSCQVETGKHHNIDLLVVDTPGFCDQSRSKEEFHAEMHRSLEMATPYPHAFVLVLDFRPYNEQNEQNEDLERLLIEVFGPTVFNYTIPVFTGLNKLQQIGPSIGEFMKNLPPTLTSLIKKCGQPHMIVKYEEQNARHTVINELITLIDRNLTEKDNFSYLAQ